MELCKQLESYGFDLRIVRDGAFERVEARRTKATQLTPQASSAMLLQLMRAQAEALRYLRTRNALRVEPFVIPQYVSPRLTEIERRLADRAPMSEWTEAALIYEWCVLMGHETTSDGLRMIDCLNEARAEAAKEGTR
jgi:hypothetical protein